MIVIASKSNDNSYDNLLKIPTSSDEKAISTSYFVGYLQVIVGSLYAYAQGLTICCCPTYTYKSYNNCELRGVKYYNFSSFSWGKNVVSFYLFSPTFQIYFPSIVRRKKWNDFFSPTYQITKNTKKTLPISHEITSISHEITSISYEMDSISYEIASISCEMNSISYEIEIKSRFPNPISYEMNSISYEMNSISYEIEVISYEIEVISHEIEPFSKAINSIKYKTKI